MDFDLRLLRHARALAEAGSFARAASSVHLTQPALSRSIQDLERRTGLKLFDRSGSRIEPTDVGRVFLAQARELLGQAEALDRDLATMRGAGTGSLAVGSGTFPSAMFMDAALRAFLAKHPRVGVRLANDNWVALIGALRRRELDLVIGGAPEPGEAQDLVVHRFPVTQGHFLVRAGHPLLARATLSLADVVAYPLVCTGRLPTELTAHLLSARGTRDPGRGMPDVACESLPMMARIAAATDHVLITPIAPHAAALAAGELVALPFVDPNVAATFAIVRLASRTLPPIAEDLVGEVIAAELAAREIERTLAAGRVRRATPASTERAVAGAAPAP